MNKILSVTASILLILSLIGIVFVMPKQNTKTKVAICPSYYYLEELLIKNNYQIIKTSSTTENFNLLNNGNADLILTGRIAKPHEENSNLKFLTTNEEGYSFLSRDQIFIHLNQMSDLDFVTDLDETKLKAKFPITKIKKVSDVYDFLDEAIVITSWENTDFSRSDVAHVLKENGDREPLSRRLNVYYLKINKEKASELFIIIEDDKHVKNIRILD